MSHRFAIDSLASRDERLFGWGWVLDDESPASAISLYLHLVDGSELELTCPQTGSRPDLAAAFPEIAHATSGGFMLQARIPQAAQIREATLRVKLEDGRALGFELPGFPTVQMAALAGAPRSNLLAVLRDGGWRALWQRVIARWSRFRSRAGFLGVRRETRASERWIVFDHAMGGGANHFRNEKLAEWRARGHDVWLVTPSLNTLEYVIEGVGSEGRRWQTRHGNLSDCLAALGHCSQIVLNNLVSFDDPLLVVEWVLARKTAGARVLFYLHDFHAVCPVWTLTGSDGRHCGVPQLDQCARCLPANPAPFLSMLPARDVPAWRDAWSKILNEADEIVAFSPSSLQILQRTYPGIEPERMTWRPHDTAYLGGTTPPFVRGNSDCTTIAVVGHISRYKGARIVAEMAELIERDRLPVRIVVIGTIEGLAPSAALTVTGPYSVGGLRGLLEDERVDVAFLPSIVHETFSYVTAELMHHCVPVAVFDLGAPAERVRGYAQGCIVSDIDAGTALREILAFHHALVAAGETSQHSIANAE